MRDEDRPQAGPDDGLVPELSVDDGLSGVPHEQAVWHAEPDDDGTYLGAADDEQRPAGRYEFDDEGRPVGYYELDADGEVVGYYELDEDGQAVAYYQLEDGAPEVEEYVQEHGEEYVDEYGDEYGDERTEDDPEDDPEDDFEDVLGDDPDSYEPHPYLDDADEVPSPTPARNEPPMRPRSSHRTPVRRRTILAASGLGAAAVGGTAWWVRRGSSDEGTAQDSPISRWRAQNGPPYFIAHRGAGIVVPEHTLEGYRAALDWGASCLEISVAMTSDRTLICMHDLTYDRTTNLKGTVADQSSDVLGAGRVVIPRLGRRWQGAGAPRIPLLSEVLQDIGSRAVLCIESKNDDAFDDVLALVRRSGLADSVFAKLHLPSSLRVQQAKAAGLSVFLYAGSRDDLAEDKLGPALKRLDPARDVIVIPAAPDDTPLPDDEVRRVVAGGVPVWAYPVWRRSEVERLEALGVKGFVTPDIGYVTGKTPVRRHDSWATGAITSGEITKSPYSEHYGMRWVAETLTMDVDGGPAFLLLGQFAPVAEPKQSYRVELDVRFDSLPSDKSAGFSLAFGHQDDSYYEPGAAKVGGYQASLTVDGKLRIHAHDGRAPEEVPVSDVARTAPLAAGAWTHVTLEVTPESMTWSRDGLAPVTSSDSKWRGGYLHVGRTGSDGSLSLRFLKVSVDGAA